jgi:hypothetical protein
MHPAPEGLLLVAAEIVAGVLMQDLVDRLVMLGDTALCVGPEFVGPDHRPVAPHMVDQTARHLLNRNGEVDDAGGNGGIGHAGLPRPGTAVGNLGKREPALLLDGLEPQRPVAAATRQQNPDGVFTGVLGQGIQEDVDRHVQAARGPRVQMQLGAWRWSGYDRAGR